MTKHVCAMEGDKIALSRKIERNFRLIGLDQGQVQTTIEQAQGNRTSYRPLVQTLQYFIGCTKKAVCTFAECLCAQCAYELVQMRGSQLEDRHATASYRNCPTDPTLRKLLIIKIQQFPIKGSKGVILHTCYIL